MKVGTVSGPAAAPAAVLPVPAPLSGVVVPHERAPAEPKKEAVANATPPAPEVKLTPVGIEAVREAAQQISEFLRKSAPSIEFVVDDAAQNVIVRIVDAETKRLIRQIPSEEALAIARALHRQGGLLVSQKA